MGRLEGKQRVRTEIRGMAAWVQEEGELVKKTKLVVKNRVLETFLLDYCCNISKWKKSYYSNPIGLKMLIIKDDQCGFLYRLYHLTCKHLRKFNSDFYLLSMDLVISLEHSYIKQYISESCLTSPQNNTNTGFLIS